MHEPRELHKKTTSRTFGFISNFIYAGFATLLSELGSNTATANLLGPLAVSAADISGTSIQDFLFPVIIGSSLGFMLPVVTPPNAIAYATGKIRLIEMIRMGLFVDLMGITLLMCLIPLYKWMQ